MANHSPDSSPPPQSSQALSQRMKGDTCFHCKKMGHWIRDCPLKSPASSASPVKPSDVPVLQCPCGAGACTVRTSRTERHPNLKFYSCPGTPSTCGFFKWCDEVWAPMCPCGAGKCSINTMKEPPHSGRNYFGCRIKKGHGACPFFQWVDPYMEILPTRETVTLANSPPEVMEIESISTEDHNHFPDVSEVDQDLDGDPLSTLDTRKLDEMLSRVSPERNVNVVESESLIPNSAARELTMEDLNTGHPHVKEMHLVSDLASPAVVHWKQTEFLNQISAAGDAPAQGISPLEPVPDHNGMDEVEGANQMCQSHVPMESEPNSQFSESSDGNISSVKHVSHATNKISASECIIVSRTEDYMEGRMLELFKQTAMSIQKEFVGLLERNQLDHEQLEQAATVCFASLDRLPVENSQFKEQVTKFLHFTASLAEIERSTNNYTLHHTLEQLNGEKERLDELFEKHAGALGAFTACDGRVKGLREDVHHMKEMLAKTEEQLHTCEVEHVELQSRLAELTQQMDEAKIRVERASQDAADASRVMESKEVERRAARAALEELLLQLRSS